MTMMTMMTMTMMINDNNDDTGQRKSSNRIGRRFVDI